MAPISETQTTTATATATVNSAAQASTLRLRPEREAWQEQLDKEGECMQIRASAVDCRLSTVECRRLGLLRPSATDVAPRCWWAGAGVAVALDKEGATG